MGHKCATQATESRIITSYRNDVISSPVHKILVLITLFLQHTEIKVISNEQQLGLLSFSF